MSVEALATWLVAALVAWVPPLHAGDRGRYDAIARDIAAVALDEGEPPLFAGASGRAMTALELGAIASMESQLRADVDRGEVRGKLGEACILQVLLPEGSGIVLDEGGRYHYERGGGWRYADLLADRSKCVRAALAKARESYRACGDLSLYTAGPPCRKNEPLAARRHGRAVGWWRAHPLAVSQASR